MQNRYSRLVRRLRRKKGIRKRIVGTPQRPRLTVYRSLKHIYAQVVDDLSGRTLVAASSVQQHLEKGGNKSAAEKVGTALAERARAAGIETVSFDRNGFRYHGRVQALADAARKGGLSF